MCGIVAVFDAEGPPPQLEGLVAASDALAHRGPDDEGYAQGTAGAPAAFLRRPAALAAPPREGPGIALAHRRLSIQDPGPAGVGPMLSRDGRIALAYNGEVYNYRELRAELARDGVRFRTQTDTEVVVEAYRRWGTDAFRRFNGMWGIALWDARSGELVLSRDRFGIKPLYASTVGTRIAAASEPAALLALGVDPAPDDLAVYAYLAAGYTDFGPRTMFSAIRQVEPGTTEVHGPAGARHTERYASDPTVPWEGDDGEAVARFRSAFLRSIELQLRSDVPVGTCLSGGLDSSSVVVAAAHHDPRRRHAFTCVFPGLSIDESRYAAAAAEKGGAVHHTVSPTGEELLDDLAAMARFAGEPLTGSSSYAQFRVMRLARETGVPVVLDGQGADEILAGYRDLRPFAAADALRRARPLEALGALARPGGPGHSPATLVRVALAFAPVSLVRRVRRHRRDALSFINPELRLRAEPALAEMEGAPRTLSDALDRALRFTLPGVLRSEDRMSMAHSIEARVPFLDHELVGMARGLPDRLKVHRGVSKVVLRRALADLLPPAVLARRDKVGFASPESRWLRGGARPALMEAIAGIPADGPLDRAAAAELLSRLDGGDDAAAPALWRMLSHQLWTRTVAGG